MNTPTLPARSELPTNYTWELESVFASNAEWESAFARASAMLPQLTAFQGRLGESAATLLAAFRLRDQAGELLGHIAVYAHHRQDEDTANSTYQALADRTDSLAAEFGAALSFLVPEVLAIPEETLNTWLASEPGLDAYRHTFAEILRERPHVLDAPMEALLAQAAELAEGPQKIFGMLNNADLKLPNVHDEQGQEVELTQGSYVARFLESRDRAVRREAFETMLGAYQGVRNTMAAALSTNVKRDIFYARARHYATAREAALAPHNIPVSVYDALVESVRDNVPALQRYLALRQRALGISDLHMYDLYVPIVPEVEYKVTFEQACETVAQALAPLGEEYVRGLREGFTARWIDVLENRGKRSGAYSGGAYGTRPFVLLNYQPSMDGMFTLAHEMGHSMHSYFTRRTQPYHYGDYTIFVAEVASTLNEALLTHHLLETTQDRALRLYILNHYLESFRTTLYRQTLFAEFERDIHARAEAGEALTADSLSALYKQINDRYYGPTVDVDELISIEWARIPHFYYNFYVYQYATGISASAALAARIISEGQPAVERYLRFLRAGSSDYSINLLRDAGVDMSTPEPVRQALDTFARYVAEMEGLL
ncbi:MAG TPA: oligoendopeptidase F [Ktedonobacterales bacterium]|nr:oligoendopeptidase F [Ktedonobacterales bacterium]